MTSKAAFRIQTIKAIRKAERIETIKMNKFIEAHRLQKPEYEDGMSIEDYDEDLKNHYEGLIYWENMKNENVRMARENAEKEQLEIWEDMCSHKYDYIDKALDELDKKKDKFAEKWWKIDISPRHDQNISVQGFIVTVNKFLKKKCFSNAEWIFEQIGYEGGEPIGTGFHCHINVMYPRSFSDLLNMTINFFKDFAAKHCCEVERISTLEYLKNRQAYIRGNKKDSKEKHKEQKMLYDKIWRKQNQIPELLGGTTSP